MVFLRIMSAILAFFALFASHLTFEALTLRSMEFIILEEITIFMVFGTVYLVLVLTTFRNCFTIPRIILFCTVDAFIWFGCTRLDFIFYATITIVLIFLVAFIIYISRLKKQIPVINVTDVQWLFTVKDNTSPVGKSSAFYSKAKFLRRAKYMYYIKLADGTTKVASIPARKAICCTIEPGKAPHVDTVMVTKYRLNLNKKVKTSCFVYTRKRYRLYVAEKEVREIF